MDKQFIAISFRQLDAVQIDLLTGMLADIGFDGFEETEGTLKAFISEPAFDLERLQDIAQSLDLPWEKSMIREQNWNAIWESSFEPVVIPGKVAVRASFHDPVKGVEHEIVITPKMSFGTGHHATTWLMMQMMTSLDFRHKTALDFGTGTGLLAILAEKLGAEAVDAIDNDPWCITNAAENLTLNGSRHIHVWQDEVLPAGSSYDCVLANINKNFLLEHRNALVAAVKTGGHLLLSGLLTEDREEIVEAYAGLVGQPIMEEARNNWIALAFRN